ncbi:MAG: NADH-quinone oxidoreductase subunit J [Proteobacteria bacterium]|nr:NADH-quinone oxidoreductase subunit J [Pseudomonadota bacterium]MBU1711224.1 NADH-quinone oxidoreductase subunit J [Pseudomonadota bacterium]
MMLFTAEGLSGVVFIGFIGITLVGALIAVHAERLIRSVCGLAICFIGISGLYYFLHSPFVALMEMLIYVGAVCVTIVFAIMLADSHPEKQVGKRNVLTGALSFAVASIIFLGVLILARRTDWLACGAKENNGSMMEVGKSLLTTNSMVFELISIVLLVAIIGSLVLARSGRERS